MRGYTSRENIAEGLGQMELDPRRAVEVSRKQMSGTTTREIVQLM